MCWTTGSGVFSYDDPVDGSHVANQGVRLEALAQLAGAVAALARIAKHTGRRGAHHHHLISPSLAAR